MLQVDENIGGRQDQKNNRLQTKTLAVGLLMLVGCFVVGYFSAGTTATATNAAHTRVSSPNGNSFQMYQWINRILFNSLPTISRSLNSCIFFFKHQPVTRFVKVGDMVSNLQHYPYVTITNKTPYVSVVYSSLKFCRNDSIDEVIAPGGTWTASSRGNCFFFTSLTIPDVRNKRGTSALTCASYASSGTSYLIYSILMKGDDACYTKQPWNPRVSMKRKKRWKELEIVMGYNVMRETMMMRIEFYDFDGIKKW